jgi:Nucleoside 2-deoxyribosyltransferase like
MQIFSVDSIEPICVHKNSIFLAGPTPRDDNVKSWRPNAIQILEELGFEGQVFVPERVDWKCNFEYNNQIEWELKYLDAVSKIVFWIPRELVTMPAFTTNIEAGRYFSIAIERCVYGRPDSASKNTYLDYVYRKWKKEEPRNTLLETLVLAMKSLG